MFNRYGNYDGYANNRFKEFEADAPFKQTQTNVAESGGFTAAKQGAAVIANKLTFGRGVFFFVLAILIGMGALGFALYKYRSISGTNYSSTPYVAKILDKKIFPVFANSAIPSGTVFSSPTYCSYMIRYSTDPNNPMGDALNTSYTVTYISNQPTPNNSVDPQTCPHSIGDLITIYPNQTSGGDDDNSGNQKNPKTLKSPQDIILDSPGISNKSSMIRNISFYSGLIAVGVMFVCLLLGFWSYSANASIVTKARGWILGNEVELANDFKAMFDDAKKKFPEKKDENKK